MKLNHEMKTLIMDGYITVPERRIKASALTMFHNMSRSCFASFSLIEQTNKQEQNFPHERAQMNSS
jgi:hypothetical protein